MEDFSEHTAIEDILLTISSAKGWSHLQKIERKLIHLVNGHPDKLSKGDKAKLNEVYRNHLDNIGDEHLDLPAIQSAEI